MIGPENRKQVTNLQLINRDVHVAKCATEAQHRRAARYLVIG